MTVPAKHVSTALTEPREQASVDEGEGRAVLSPGAAASKRGLGRARDSKTRAKTRRAREFQRIAVRCGCWLEHEQATVFGSTVDLGRGGLFLRTALPMPTGVSVRVTLQLPGEATVVADGQIVRTVAPRTGDRAGLGVRFDRLPDGEDSLCAFLFGSLRDEHEAGALVSPTLVEARPWAREQKRVD